MLNRRSPLTIGNGFIAALLLLVLAACETTSSNNASSQSATVTRSANTSAIPRPANYIAPDQEYDGLATSCVARFEQQEQARRQNQRRNALMHSLGTIPASDMTLIAEVSGDDLLHTGETNLAASLRLYWATHTENPTLAPITFSNGGNMADLGNITNRGAPYFIDGQTERFHRVGQRNLSLVPTTMIDRVEFLRLEADETTHGDAYSGVINVILVDTFEGTTIASLTGISPRRRGGGGGGRRSGGGGSDGEETFVITGSRIARAEVSSGNPVTIISGDELRSTGQSNLGGSLRQTLSAGSGGFNQANVLQSEDGSTTNGSVPDINSLDDLLRAVRSRRLGDSAANEARERQFRTARSSMSEDEIRAFQATLVEEYNQIVASQHNGPNRENYEDQAPNPFQLVTDSPVSTFSADVDTASYSNMRRILTNCSLPQRGSIRTEELVNYFSYDYASTRRRTQPFAPTVWLTPTPWNEATQLLHVGIRGFEIPRRQQPLMNLVFLVDVSGSMGSANKLPLVQESLRLLVREMRPNDTISLVVYAGRTEVVLEPTDARNRDVILRAIDGLRSGGSTAGAAGISLAYDMAEANFDEARVNRVILSTDGDFNVGIRDPDALRDFIAGKRETGVYFSYLGFGAGNYNDVMAQRLAQAGNGNASYIDSIDEARKVLVEEMRSTLIPIANDVKYQIEFNPAHVAEYRLIGYETRMLNREDFNNDLVDAGDVGSGHTVTALYEIVPVGSSALHYEPLRYQDAPELSADAPTNELAFLRMRFKMPGEDTSQLIERPITVDETTLSLEAASHDARFAAAVAAFGQHLRHDPYLPEMTLTDIRTLAASSLGDDEGGYRAEFLELVDVVRLLEGRAGAGE